MSMSQLKTSYFQDDTVVDVSKKIAIAVNCIIIPVVSAVGIVGNVLSILVLRHHGLHKSSYILLIALAVADIMFLVGSYGIPQLIYTWSQPHGYHYGKSVSYILYLWDTINLAMASIGRCCSLTLPVLITLERLWIIFFPHRFANFLTVRRTWVTVGIFFAVWFAGIALAMIRFRRFEYKYVPELNMTFGLAIQSEFVKMKGINYAMVEFGLQLQGTVPVCLVAVGCTAIGIKVKVQHSKRRRLMSNVSSSRTTKMLLAVCVMYMIAGGYACWSPYMMAALNPIEMQAVNIVAKLLLCLNSSLNFVIYVVMNKTFRETYRSLLTRLYASCVCKREQ